MAYRLVAQDPRALTGPGIPSFSPQKPLRGRARAIRI
jgi:hypothetical protein